MDGGTIESNTKSVVSVDESSLWLNCDHENDKLKRHGAERSLFMMCRLYANEYQVEMFSFLRDVTLLNANYTGYKTPVFYKLNFISALLPELILFY